jgi:5-formyltetrahydrofolate cyclo-ligase
MQALPMDDQGLKTWRIGLRSRLIARRIATTPEQHAAWSAALDTHLEELLTDVAARIIAFCWPYQAEFDARPAILRCLSRGARAALPVVVAARQAMVFREWTPEMPLQPGVYDIPVPIGSDEVRPDILLIPLTGFDDRGYRLGYGGGFFDRTLPIILPRPMTIGLGFELARVPTIYPKWHDIAMDYIVTESGIYRQSGTSGLLQIGSAGLQATGN